MEHFFELPVVYNNEQLSYRARLVTFGYTYKFYVVIDGKEIIFEKDDEMNYRAVNYSPDQHINIKKELLEAVIDSLQDIAKA